MNIGLIAHDSKKKLMQNFCIAYKGILNKNQLFATGTTGRLIEEVTNLYQESQDIYLVADVLGHKDVNTTRKHYAEIVEENKRSARNIVKLRKD